MKSPIRSKCFFSSAPIPLMTRANAREVYRALEKVEFMAVSDFFITPTAELADIVLPAATWLEMDYIGDFWKRHGYMLPRRKVIQVGECRCDHEMLNDLAHRVGQGEHWWDDFEQALDWILEPAGITWQKFKKMDYLRGEVQPMKYRERGFSTPTRKFELVFHPAGNLGLRSTAAVSRAAREPRQYPGTIRNLSLYPHHGRQIARVFSTLKTGRLPGCGNCIRTRSSRFTPRRPKKKVSGKGIG